MSIAYETALMHIHSAEQVATRCCGFRSLGHLLARVSPSNVALARLESELDTPTGNAKVCVASSWPADQGRSCSLSSTRFELPSAVLKPHRSTAAE